MPMLAVATMSWPSSDTGTASASWMRRAARDRKSTRLNSSHDQISYAVFCLKKKILRHHAAGITRPGDQRHLGARGPGLEGCRDQHGVDRATLSVRRLPRVPGVSLHHGVPT